MRTTRFEVCEQFGKRQPKTSRDLQDRCQPQIHISQLDPRDIAGRQAAALGKGLLGETLLFAQALHLRAERFELRLFGHVASVSGLPID